MSKVVLITGCRSGFGLLAAAEIARRGHRVYAGLRDPATADGLRDATRGLPVTPIALDVTDAAQRSDAVAKILDAEGQIDVLVNNAGIALGGFLETVEEDEFRQVLDTNVIAPWALTREVLPSMRLRRSGRILMISSMSGRIGLPGVGVYAASKWGLEGMTESWRHELALFGIDVALVEPAQFKTDIFSRNKRLARKADDPASPWYPFAKALEARVDGMVQRTAGDPMDVARLLADLVDAPKIKLRYPIGPNAWMREALGRYLPFGITERVIARMIRPRT